MEELSVNTCNNNGVNDNAGQCEWLSPTHGVIGMRLDPPYDSSLSYNQKTVEGWKQDYF